MVTQRAVRKAGELRRQRTFHLWLYNDYAVKVREWSLVNEQDSMYCAQYMLAPLQHYALSLAGEDSASCFDLDLAKPDEKAPDSVVCCSLYNS